jgi:hypothetical protein
MQVGEPRRKNADWSRRRSRGQEMTFFCLSKNNAIADEPTARRLRLSANSDTVLLDTFAPVSETAALPRIAASGRRCF